MTAGTALDASVCPLCGARRGTTLLSLTARRRDTLTALTRCDDCGLVRAEPPVGERQAFVADEIALQAKYFSGGHAAQDDRLFIADLIESFTAGPGRMLDFGCGPGMFLDVMRARRWEVQGVEPDPLAAQWARRYLGLTVIEQSPAKASLPEGHFDLVTAFGTPARAERPLDALKTLRDALAPGGVLVLSAPNLDGTSFAAEGEEWLELSPEYRVYFQPETLRRALTRAGFAVEMLAEVAGERANDRLLAVARKPGRRFVVKSDAPSRLARLLWRVRLRLKALAPHWAPVRKLLKPKN